VGHRRERNHKRPIPLALHSGWLRRIPRPSNTSNRVRLSIPQCQSLQARSSPALSTSSQHYVTQCNNSRFDCPRYCHFVVTLQSVIKRRYGLSLFCSTENVFTTGFRHARWCPRITASVDRRVHWAHTRRGYRATAEALGEHQRTVASCTSRDPFRVRGTGDRRLRSRWVDLRSTSKRKRRNCRELFLPACTDRTRHT
jgi:hypothetical protein